MLRGPILGDSVLCQRVQMGIRDLSDSNLLQGTRPSLRQRVTRAALRIQQAVHAHPLRVAAATAVLLATSAMTAFGVAPLTGLPELNAPAVTQVQEAVALPQLAGQLAQLDEQSLALYRNDVSRPTDTVDSLLQRLGVDDADAAQFIRNDPTAATLMQGRAGKSVKVVVENGRLQKLVARGAPESSDIDTHFHRLTLERVRADGMSHWEARKEVLPLEVKQQMASGVIDTSLYAAADDAHVPEGIINQMAEIFGSDIDFRRELRKGDAFSVLYEAHTADGEPLTWASTSGRVLAARFINKGKAHDAVWYQEPGRKGNYYDLNGQSKTRAFLASPLAFSRVTSGFAMRFHPILQKWRAHLGVDFGAPTGTPVRSVGEGVVTFAGQQNGYGNVVELQHSGNRKTVYAHLSRIDVRKGARVAQGQLIGAVGATGWATGPHLHFEFKIGDRQVDPMTMARASESLQLSGPAIAAFRNLSTKVARQLQQANDWQTAGSPSGPRFE